MSIILIIDDEQPRFTTAKPLFAAHGHIAHTMNKMVRTQDAFLQAQVVLLNLCRTEPEEEAALREVRMVSSVPVVVASSHSEERTITGLLNLGADDYLVKPFSLDHVVARLEAVLRRIPATSPSADFVEIGGLHINFSARSILKDGNVLGLTPTEFDLLALLAKCANTVVSREEAIRSLWGRVDQSTYQVLRVHVSSLRRKLGDSAATPRYLHTLHGVGLKLTWRDHL